MVFLFSLVCTTCSAQITAIHFNADWNKQNSVEWFNKLGDCDKQSFLVEYDDGEEVKRYQADLSFTMQATKKEIQNYIDELIISKF